MVFNREPYIHERKGKSVEAVVPPSGLVTALEPVLEACDGTWIAHGSGNADAEVVDSHDQLRVPPRDPRYTLRQVWLNKERRKKAITTDFQTKASGLIATLLMPAQLFRAQDWQHYREVNRKFTTAVLEK